MLPTLLSPAQAARALTLSPDYVRRLVREGALPCVRFGRRMALREADVAAYVAARAASGPAATSRLGDIPENRRART